MSADAKKRRTNLPAQERVVSALWHFAAQVARQARENPSLLTADAPGATYSSPAFADAVGETLAEVCAAYGYAIKEVQ